MFGELQAGVLIAAHFSLAKLAAIIIAPTVSRAAEVEYFSCPPSSATWRGAAADSDTEASLSYGARSPSIKYINTQRADKNIVGRCASAR